MIFLRFTLLPFSLLYGIAVFFRNALYDIGILPSQEFEKGVIAIGNLSAGGTGKSPMTEYLVRLLKEKFQVATLSRGYKRHTRGFLLAEINSSSFQVGDEPMQFKRKFPDITVAVDENRRHGIKKLFSLFAGLHSILLDDAFQHRRIKAGLSILLSDYAKMYYDDFLLPAGTLREFRKGKMRADIIVVTKCPESLSPVEKRIIHKKINPEPHQHVFFSFVKYGEPIAVFPARSATVLDFSKEKMDVLALSGISNPMPFENYLRSKTGTVIPARYPNHHQYSLVEVNQLVENFSKITAKNKAIITTEKDAMRLNQPGFAEVLDKLPFYYIPIEITFEEKEREEFNKLVIDYVIRTNPDHHSGKQNN